MFPQRSGIFGRISSHQKSLDGVVGISGGKSAGSGSTTIIQTVFNEFTTGHALAGTQPALNTPGAVWTVWPTLGDLTFASGGGVSSTTTFKADTINTGHSIYTVTFSGLTNMLGGGFNLVCFSIGVSTNDRLQVTMKGAGGVSLDEVIGGTTTAGVATAPSVPNGATGSVVASLNGNAVTITAFGVPMSYTIPGGRSYLGGSFIGLFAGDLGYTFGGVKVTVP